MIPVTIKVDFVCDAGELITALTAIGLPAVPPEGTVIPLPRNPGGWLNWVGVVTQLEMTEEYEFVAVVCDSLGEELKISGSAEDNAEALRRAGWTVIDWCFAG